MQDTERMTDELFGAAVEAYTQGQFEVARGLAETLLRAAPAHAPGCNLAGLAAFAAGDPTAAVGHLRRAAELDPEEAEYPNNLGVILHAVDDFAAARPAFERALALDPAQANAANNLGSVLEKLGDDAEAIALYRRALEIDPAFVEARDNLVLACARVAPQWHFPMMADAARNAAYAAALQRAAPGRQVLDIGSGSGLLAMLAARAGATRVDSCEMQPVIAGIAQAIVAANGLDHRVTVWPLKSDQLEPVRDLATPADVLVTETFSSGLLSEHVLPTVEDAHRRLLIPGAAVIPRRAAAMGYLVGGRQIEDHFFAAGWESLDLSGFDLLAPYKLGLHLDRVPHTALSRDFEIFGFDLTAPPFPPQRRRLDIEVTTAGRCVGVAQWLRLNLDAAAVYENRPTPQAGANGWMHVVYRFAQPLDVLPGDRVAIVAGHNRAEIVVALATDGPE